MPDARACRLIACGTHLLIAGFERDRQRFLFAGSQDLNFQRLIDRRSRNQLGKLGVIGYVLMVKVDDDVAREQTRFIGGPVGTVLTIYAPAVAGSFNCLATSSGIDPS